MFSYAVIILCLCQITTAFTTIPINAVGTPSKDELKQYLYKLIDRKERSSMSNDMRIDTASRLSYIYPPKEPLSGWKETRHNPLNGKWELIYTTAPDATVELGKVFQEVDVKNGTFTNIIKFNSDMKILKEIRVLIEVKPDEEVNNRMNLYFKRFTIFRKSRFSRKIHRISLPIPSFRILKAFSSSLMINSGIPMKNPYKTIMYVDEDMRIHKSSANKWYIQKKVSRNLPLPSMSEFHD